jgi:hypothetical protein
MQFQEYLQANMTTFSMQRAGARPMELAAEFGSNGVMGLSD